MLTVAVFIGRAQELELDQTKELKFSQKVYVYAGKADSGEGSCKLVIILLLYFTYFQSLSAYNFIYF